MTNTDALMRDEWEIRKLAMNYARTVDRGDGAGFAALFTEDAAVEGPGFRVQGYDQLFGNPGMLKQMYTSTMHTVMNQTVTIAGDTAEGETYCIAYHMSRPNKDGKYMRFDMFIRYQDKFRRVNGAWKFTRRHLEVDWVQTVEVQMMGG